MARAPSRIGSTVALLATVLTLSACGETERNNDYVEAVNKAQNSFAATFERLQGQITRESSQRQDRATLNRFQDAIDKVVADLRAVETPAKVKALHNRLIAQIASYSDEIEQAERAFRSKDPARILGAQGRLVTAVTQVSTKINATIDSINRRLRE